MKNTVGGAVKGLEVFVGTKIIVWLGMRSGSWSESQMFLIQSFCKWDFEWGSISIPIVFVAENEIISYECIHLNTINMNTHPKQILQYEGEVCCLVTSMAKCLVILRLKQLQPSTHSERPQWKGPLWRFWILWQIHPSLQNSKPHAGPDTFGYFLIFKTSWSCDC